MTSFQCVGVFSPTAVCFEGEQNREGYEPPKRIISTQEGWGPYRILLYKNFKLTTIKAGANPRIKIVDARPRLGWKWKKPPLLSRALIRPPIVAIALARARPH